MKILKQFKKAGLFLLFLSFLSATTFAQTYVSATDGDDGVGTGTISNPYLTIAAGITAAGDGGAVVIEPGDYAEAVTVGNDMTFTVSDFGGTGFTTVTINGLVINTANATDVVSFGETGLDFLIETTAGLTLTKGVLNILAANVVMESGATINRAAGSINVTPTFTNMTVNYTSVIDIASGPELPLDLGSGLLTVNMTAAKTLTVDQAFTTSGGVTVTTGALTVTGILTLEDAAVYDNAGADDVSLQAVSVEIGGNNGTIFTNSGVAASSTTVNGTFNFVQDGTAFDYTAAIVNGAGDLTLANGFTAPGVDNAGTDYFPLVAVTNGAGDLTASDAITATVITNTSGAVVLTGGTGTDLINTAGTTELAADFALSGVNITVTAGTVKLNANTLTLSNATAVVTNAGDIISTTASTVGAGTVAATGALTTVNGTGEMPNITIAAAKTLLATGIFTAYGDVTVGALGTLNVNAAVTVSGNLTSTGDVDLAGAGITVEGNYAQNTGGTLDFGINVFAIEGDWFRDSNVLSDVTFGTGTLTFQGDDDVTFTPGAQLTIANIIINKTLATETVTLAQTVKVDANFTITKGQFLLDNHLRMLSGVFTNGSTGYLSNNDSAFLIIDGASNLAGAATYSNLDIRAATTLNNAIEVNGIVNHRTANLVLGAFNFTFNDDYSVNNEYNFYTDAAGITNGGGTFAVSSTTYDLTYLETTARTGVEEVLTAGIRNLTVSTAGATVRLGAVVSISGTLTVAGTATLDLQDGALTLPTDGLTHSVMGTVEDGGGATDNLVVTGDGVTIDGGTATTSVRTIELLTVNLGAATETFTLNNIINLDLLTNAVGVSTVSLVDDGKSTVVDHATLGNLNLVTGAVTLTLNGATPDDVVGVSDLKSGTLTLGSDVTFASTLSQGSVADASIVLGAFDLTVKGDFTHDNAGTITGTGKLVMSENSSLIAAAGFPSTATVTVAAGEGSLFVAGDEIVIIAAANAANDVTFTVASVAGDVVTAVGTPFTISVAVGGSLYYTGDITLTTDLAVSNLEIASTPANGTSDVTAGDLEVTNGFTLTSGTFDTGANLFELSGTKFTVVAGTLPGTGIVTFSGTDVEFNTKVDVDIASVTMNVTSLALVEGNTTATVGGLDLGIPTSFIQTAGNIDLGANNLIIDAAWTRTAGDYAMTTGKFVIDNAGAAVPDVDQGAGWAVDNLKIMTNTTTMTTDKPFTVNKSLELAKSFDANTTVPDPENLILADGVTIERSGVGAVLSEDPNYVNTVNLVYSAANTTSNEVPTAVGVLNDVTVSAALVLAKDLTVNGTLKVDNTTVDITTTNSKDLNLASGATVYVVDYAVGMFDEALKPAGLLNVTIEETGGTGVTVDDDILDKDFTIGTLTIDGAVAADIVTLHDNLTVVTLDVIDDGPLAIAAKNLTVTNALLDGVGATGFVTATTGNLIFAGANAGVITLGDDWAVPAALDVVLSKTNNSDIVTLSGGNLDFATTANDLVLTKGVLETDATSKVILKQLVDSLQPTQGFTRTSGVIAGNVEKYINNSTTIDISKVEYPTGDADGNYRPANFYFTTAPLSSINLLVNYNGVSPSGTTNLPMSLDNQTITNYPDFSWKVLSDVSLAPSYQFDVEFQAEGYSDYLLDGIGNVRLIRRGDGNTANPWVLQGLEANYDNSTIAADWPLVKVVDATGGITSEGALFTYSQSNKAPVVVKTATVNSGVADVSTDVVTISEDTDTLVVSYVVTDPDIGDSATTTVSVPDGAVWDADAKTMTWTPGLAQVGEYLAIITATDTYAQVTKDTLTITVVNTPSFAVSPADSVNVTEGITNTYQYTGGLDAGDPDSLTFTYAQITSGTIDADSVSIVDTTGVLSVSPVLGDTSDVFTVIVTATDNTGGAVADTTVFTVVKLSQAPVFAVEMADTNVDANSLLTLDFGPNASDPDGDTLTFTHTLLLDGVAVADSVGNGSMTAAGVYTWTPLFNQNGEYVLVANASDGALSADDSVNVTVNFVNTPPVWVAEMPNQTVFLGDTLTFTYNATDANNDSVTYAFNGAYPPAATLDAATGEFSWTPTTALQFPVVIKVKATDGTDSVTTQAEVVVEVTTVNLSGVVTYNGGELLENVEVTLSDGQKDTTGADGAYSFIGISAGEYTVTAAKADQVGGALASDALETQLYIVNPDSTFLATDMQKLAADVVGVGNITSSDALAILNRSVGIDDFQVADWLFESKTITVATTNKVQDLKGIAAGDARGDYSPALGLAKTSNLVVNNGEVLNIKKQSEFELPISMAELTEVGSYTMKLQYAADKVEFLGATTSNGGMLVSNVKDNVISIAWMSLDSKVVKVKEGGALATLKFKATELFSKSDELSLELLAGSELTDRMAKNINAGISIPVVAIGIPDVFALRQNYPNPFNPSTTIQYDLPQNGKVTLTIYNSLGQTVGTLVNQKQEAGAYDVNFNASNLASGVYLYRVTVEGTKNFVMTKKMILMK